MKKLQRTTYIWVILCGCFSMSACSNMEYVSSHALAKSYNLSLHQGGSSVTPLPKHYGAIKLTRSPGVDSEEQPQERVFLLKREKGHYMAETLLFDHSTEPNRTFEKSFLSFGANRDNRSVGLALRFIY